MLVLDEVEEEVELLVEDDVLEPPVDVDVLDPPVEVLEPPVEVLDPPVEVEPPLVLVDPPELDEVEEMNQPPLDPPPPPQKPPLPPPTITGALPPPPPPIGISAGIGTGAGAALAMVIAAGAQAVWVVVIVRTLRITLRCATRTGAFACLIYWRLISVRCGASAIWTAPPPMIAPPHAQAHNLAKAIRTDIAHTLFSLMPTGRCAEIQTASLPT